MRRRSPQSSEATLAFRFAAYDGMAAQHLLREDRRLGEVRPLGVHTGGTLLPFLLGRCRRGRRGLGSSDGCGSLGPVVATAALARCYPSPPAPTGCRMASRVPALPLVRCSWPQADSVFARARAATREERPRAAPCWRFRWRGGHSQGGPECLRTVLDARARASRPPTASRALAARRGGAAGRPLGAHDIASSYLRAAHPGLTGLTDRHIAKSGELPEARDYDVSLTTGASTKLRDPGDEPGGTPFEPPRTPWC